MSRSNNDADDAVFNLKYLDSVPALARAAATGNLNKIKQLLAAGALPQTPDNSGWTSIHYCVLSNQIKALKLILKLKYRNKKYLVNLTTWEGITPLLIAVKAQRPSIRMLRVLLRAGADPKQCTPVNSSPLHFVCLNHGNIDCAKLLVQYGVDVNVQEDLNLNTALHLAISKAADLEVTKFLIVFTDLNLMNSSERTPFLEACHSNFIEAVKLFLDIDKGFANDKSHLPPLVYSGFSGNLELTKLLIDSGADVNSRCKAMVPHKSDDSDFILFDQKNFLPIHSSLTDLQVFKLLLILTKKEELLKLERNYYSFFLFVLIFADEIFSEELLQSKLPNELKTFGSDVLVTFILSYPDLNDTIFDKFLKMFKYNFSLTAESVFQSFANKLKRETLKPNIPYLYVLALLGVSSINISDSKKIIIKHLEDYLTRDCCEHTELACHLLSQSVLSLKQLCRNTLRDQIKSHFKCDWLALKMIREAELPEMLKKFLLFDSVS